MVATRAQAGSDGDVVVLSVNTCWNVANFRAGLIRGLQHAGYRVVALAPLDRHVERVRALGCELIDLPMDAKGVNPLRDLQLLWRYRRALKRLRPRAFLGFTIKPNVYGSLAAQSLGIPVVNNVAGLGTTFLRGGWLNRVARLLYRTGLWRSARVFFQNGEDRFLFIQGGLCRAEQADLLPGSGVDLERFTPRMPNTNGGPIKVLLVARMLWDKGVGELVEAVRRVRDEGVDCELRLLGFLDVRNPSSIPREQIASWQTEGFVFYLGEADDVRDHLDAADVVALPSYREVTPRSLLEAAAMSKPIITTDAPGCRDVVEDGVNGYRVPIRDIPALADALQRFARLSPEERIRMGAASRTLVELRYDERIVVKAYLDALAKIAILPGQIA
jgi:glycosyltransferase involved in cell wall biosynthesis